ATAPHTTSDTHWHFGIATKASTPFETAPAESKICHSRTPAYWDVCRLRCVNAGSESPPSRKARARYASVPDRVATCPAPPGARPAMVDRQRPLGRQRRHATRDVRPGSRYAAPRRRRTPLSRFDHRQRAVADVGDVDGVGARIHRHPALAL